MHSAQAEITFSLGRLEALYGAFEALVLPSSETLFRPSAVSGWTAAEHLAHAFLANELCARNLRQLASGAGLLVRADAAALEGVAALLASGKLPRGKAEAPRIVRPPSGLRREQLAEYFAASRSALAELQLAGPLVASARLRIPHQILGPLDAAEWARFAEVHTRHHAGIVVEVLRATDGPAEPLACALAEGAK